MMFYSRRTKEFFQRVVTSSTGITSRLCFRVMKLINGVIKFKVPKDVKRICYAFQANTNSL